MPAKIDAMMRGLMRHPYMIASTVRESLRGQKYARGWASIDQNRQTAGAAPRAGASNPLREYFDANREGPGIWKWDHYFQIYQRHFGKFVGREVHVVEIGIYSGGSLPMWKAYFGPGCRVYGVDIEEACKAYEGDRTRVFIGDQADRGFWARFRSEVPSVDILIDDGGHTPEQQIVTLEEMLPHLRPGGVYLCEDVHGRRNGFNSYVHGLGARLNAFEPEPIDRGAGIAASATPFQSAVDSIHHYPFVTVIERTDAPVEQFVAPKHGTEWQPFL